MSTAQKRQKLDTVVENLVAASYIRMSDDKQKESPDQQRDALATLREQHGYAEGPEFFDAGITGDSDIERNGFAAMMRAVEAGGIDVILCWDQDRFGRLEMLDSAPWVKQLQRAKVKLHTVTAGVFDFADQNDVFRYMAIQMGKHQYLKDLSRNVVRAIDAKFAAGKWPSSKCPDGYVIGPEGRLIFDSAERVHLIRGIFSAAAAGRSFQQIAEDLNAAGKRTREGRIWQRATIGRLLQNPTYLGHTAGGRWSRSKYRHPERYAEIKEKGRGRSASVTMKMPPQDWQIRHHTHEPIIDQKTLQRVRDAVERNGSKRGPSSRRQFIFTGLTYCQHCGSVLGGKMVDGVRNYMCGGYVTRKCERYIITEAELLEAVRKSIRGQFLERYFSPPTMERIEAELRRQLSESSLQRDIESVAASLEIAQADVDKYSHNLMDLGRAAGPEWRKKALDVLKGAETRRDELATKLAEVSRPGDAQVIDFKQRIENVRGWLERVDRLDLQTAAERQDARELLANFVDRIDVATERYLPSGRAKRHRCRLIGGEITMKTSGLPMNAASLVSIGPTASRSLPTDECDTLVISLISA